MAVNVFRVALRDWKTCVWWSYGRQLVRTSLLPMNFVFPYVALVFLCSPADTQEG